MDGLHYPQPAAAEALPQGGAFGMHIVHGRAAVQARLGGTPLATMRQVHGGHVAVLRGATHADIPETDAMISTTPGQVLATYTRDCLPLALRDAHNGVIGIAHLSAQSLAAQLHTGFIRAYLQAGGQGRYTQAWIGPHHTGYWLPDSHETAQAWQHLDTLRAHMTPHDVGQVMLHLEAAVRAVLQDAAIQRIAAYGDGMATDDPQRSTYTNAALPSHRRMVYVDRLTDAERVQQPYIYTTVTL